MKRLRNFCFTLNNYEERDVVRLRMWAECDDPKEVQYMIVGAEVGEKGTPHLQGYVQLAKQISFSTLKEMGFFERAHIEACKGSAEDNITYCSKEGNVLIEFGEPKQQGRRNDLRDVKNAIKEKMGLRQMVEEERVRTLQGFSLAQKMLPLFEPKRTWKPEVIWIHGPPGSGKSRQAYEMAPDAYTKDVSHKWWDGYDSHTDVILDDFRDSQMGLTELLRILDRYECRVEVKGGTRQLVARRIIITSIFAPDKMYLKAKGEPLEQLLRRIDKIVECSEVAVSSVCSEVEGNTMPRPEQDEE